MELGMLIMQTNKFAQQHDVQKSVVKQEKNVSTHNMISLCKLQFLGLSHTDNMYKATYMAIIFAYDMEEETV
jgi:hypothetical protein